MKTTHFSCFSGIGGIDLAAEWAGFETVGQVEFADYPYQVLCKHWPDVPKWRDIKDVNGDEIRSVCGDVTVLSGGFPCQPHSFAGKRKGTTDDRNLWPELRRVIREVKPRWFLGENVPGLLSSDANRFFGGVLRDLAEMGYNVGWCSYEAARVGAPHRRERVFIIAYSDMCRRVHGQSKELSAEAREQALSELKPGCQDVADSGSIDVQGKFSSISYTKGWTEQSNGSARSCSDGLRWWTVEPGVGRVADGFSFELDIIRGILNAEINNQKTEPEKRKLVWEALREMWEYRELAKTSPEIYIERMCDFVPEVPYPDTCRKWILGKRIEEDEELCDMWQSVCSEPFEKTQDLQQSVLKRIGEKKRPKEMGSRSDRIKCLGNAVVPQQVYPVLKAIADIERGVSAND